jgi:retron-type reverse transcriptase
VLRMVAHRIADRRILRLIRGWLRAGGMEGQRWSETVQGTPQGSGISPLLANIFMHYASTCGFINGGDGMHGDELLSCGTVTTS